MSENSADSDRDNRPFPRSERDRLVVVPPYRRRPAADYSGGGEAPLTAAEIGRKALALRGWRRMLARFAGLPVE